MTSPIKATKHRVRPIVKNERERLLLGECLFQIGRALDWALMELSSPGPAMELFATSADDAGARGAGVVALSTRDVCVSLCAPTAPPTSASVGAQRAAQLGAPATPVGWRGDGGLLLPGREWRFSGALQRSHWLCANCDRAVPNERERCDCGGASSVLARMAQQEARRRGNESMAASAYGRNLVFMSGTAQSAVMPSFVGGFFEDDYTARVAADVHSLAPNAHKTERREYLPEGVWDFDAFLALETRGKYCFQDADAARDFLSCGKAESVMEAFVALHGVAVVARGLDGEMASVQVCTALTVLASVHIAHRAPHTRRVHMCWGTRVQQQGSPGGDPDAGRISGTTACTYGSCMCAACRGRHKPFLSWGTRMQHPSTSSVGVHVQEPSTHAACRGRHEPFLRWGTRMQHPSTSSEGTHG